MIQIWEREIWDISIYINISIQELEIIRATYEWGINK